MITPQSFFSGGIYRGLAVCLIIQSREVEMHILSARDHLWGAEQVSHAKECVPACFGAREMADCMVTRGAISRECRHHKSSDCDVWSVLPAQMRGQGLLLLLLLLATFTLSALA